MDLKEIRMPEGQDAYAPREKLNRNVLLACQILAGLSALAAFMIERSAGNEGSLISDSALSVPTAILLAILWVVILPAIAVFWHRKAIDEQEEAAFRDGAYFAAYAFLVAAPTWWILWRGGLAPAPDGIAIYLLFMVIWTLVWLKKKYM